jgi:hypothetical protein
MDFKLSDWALSLLRRRGALPGAGGRVPRRMGAALGEVGDLFGDHGEPHAGFTCPCRFHSRIQGQDVGLEGDLVDDLGNP